MQIIEEWAGHYYDQSENSDKVWAACFTDTGAYLAVWGRRDNRKYQSQTKTFTSVAAARAQFEQLVRQKERKGYQKVPFENASFGNIPSFSRSLGGSSPVGIGKITGPNLLERLRQLLRRIKAQFEPDSMLVEFQQLKAATALILEYKERISQEEDIGAELEAALNTVATCLKQALLT